MKKSDIVVCGVAACAAACAIAGVASGREWRLLLVPAAILPPLKMAGSSLKYHDLTFRRAVTAPSGTAFPSLCRAMAVAIDVIGCVAATNFALEMSRHFGGGSCAWAPVAMAAAVTAAAMLPFFTEGWRYPALRNACLSVELASLAAMPLLLSDSRSAAGLGGIFIALVYAPIRVWLAVRNRKKEVPA